MRIFLDVSRLHQRGRRSTPTGIDRVEYAYFVNVLENPAGIEPHFVVFDRLLEGVLRRERALELRRLVSDAWNLGRPAVEDPVFQELERELARPLRAEQTSPARMSAPAETRGWRDGLLTGPRDMLRARVRLERRVARGGPAPAIYLHTSHSRLDKATIPRWLAAAGLAPVFFLHDVIPMDYPEFCRPGEADRHLARLRSIAAHAAVILTNSRTSADAARAQLAAHGLREPPFAVVPLGVEDCFRNRSSVTAIRPAHPYFVVVGTIEPRKNLAFLLEVWRGLVARAGAAAPRLVVIGRRGWENENIVDYLERSRGLAPYLVEASDLSDAGLAALMAGARAVLAPSLAEGFSLPVAEALALGAPVVCSDIPVHREIAGDGATFVAPIDGRGWIEAIEARCAGAVAAPARAGLAPGWREHVETALGLICEHVGDRGERPRHARG